MAWLEAHQSLQGHPKTRKAAVRLGVPRPQVIGHLFCLWWWALDYAPDGDVTAFGADDLALAAEWGGDPELFVAALVECRYGEGAGLLERTADGRLLIHDWWEYAGKLLQRREKDRERKKVAVPVEAPPSLPIDSVEFQGSSDGIPTDGARTDIQTDRPTEPTNTPPPAAPVSVPEKLRGMHGVFDGLPRYAPTPEFFGKVEQKYGHLDLEEEAIKAREWLATQRSRACSVGFILNWLSKAAERQATAPITPLGRNGHAPPPQRWAPPDFERRGAPDELRRQKVSA